MNRSGLVFLCVLGSAVTLGAQGAPKELPKGWTAGPTVGRLGAPASVSVPPSYIFLDASATKAFLEQNQNIPDGNELGSILSTDAADDSWFAVFTYADTGHVDDTDQAAIDATALMENLKKGTEHGNKERRDRGFDELVLTGWQQPPFYDPATNNLTWSTRLTSQDVPVINHSVRLLGRTGTMSVQLVADPKSLAAATTQFNTILTGFTYVDGQRYAEFRQGDKLAGYGLAALIAGGAGAAAVKSGLLQKFWKVLVMIGVAIVAGLKKFLGALSGNREPGLAERPVAVPPAPRV